ncbi:MAG: hypothetical protein LBL83_04005 [Clostridiales bacterium]|jgi:hypothetical protein|nr:hypothetical protein [Clostridiales bacterium]
MTGKPGGDGAARESRGAAKEANGAAGIARGAGPLPKSGGGRRGAGRREYAFKALMALLVGLFMFALYLNNQSTIERVAAKNRAAKEAARGGGETAAAGSGEAQADAAGRAGEASVAGSGGGVAPAAAGNAGASEAGESEGEASVAGASGGGASEGGADPDSPAEFALLDYDGSAVPFSSFSGSVVFLVFWSEDSPQSAQLLRTFGEYAQSAEDGGSPKVLNVFVPPSGAPAGADAPAGANGLVGAAGATTGAPAGADAAVGANDAAGADAPARAGPAPGAAMRAELESRLAECGLAPENSFYDGEASLARTFMVADYPSVFVFAKSGRLADYSVGPMDAERIQKAAQSAEAA